MKNKGFIVIMEWQYDLPITDMRELLLFALIYGFSQDGRSKFYGSLAYLEKKLMCSRPTVIKAINGLIEKNLIIKYNDNISGQSINYYSANNNEIIKYTDVPEFKKKHEQKSLEGSKEILQGGSKNSLQGGSKETLHNNNILDNSFKKEKSKKEQKISNSESKSNKKPSINTNFPNSKENKNNYELDKTELKKRKEEKESAAALKNEYYDNDNHLNIVRPFNPDKLTPEMEKERGNAFSKEFLNSTTVLEDTARYIKKTIPETKQLMKDYLFMIKAEGSIFQSYSQLRKRFTHWAKKRTEIR